MGAADVALLGLLIAAAKKQNDFGAILAKLHAVAFAFMYAQFAQSAADGLDVAKVT